MLVQHDPICAVLFIHMRDKAERFVVYPHTTLYQRLQPLLLAVVAPLALALLGFMYMGHVHMVLVQKLQRSLDYAAEQGASIIEARLQSRLLALSTLASHPLIRDTDVPDWRKLELILEEVERRGLIRFGIAQKEGKMRTTDARDFAVLDRKYFQEARAGNPSISDLLIDRVGGENIVVHAVPIRDNDGEVLSVLFGVEDAQKLASLLDIHFSYEGLGTALMVDESGMEMGARRTDGGNFFTRLAWENPPEALERLRRQWGQPQASMNLYRYQGKPVYIRTATVPGGGWALVLIVPEEAATSVFRPLLNLTTGTLVVIAFLLLGCGLYIMALRRGYLRQRGFTEAAIHAAGIYQLTVDEGGRILSSNEQFQRCMGWSGSGRLYRLQDLGSPTARAAVEKSLARGELFTQKLTGAGGMDIFVQWHVLPGRHSGESVLLGTDFSQREQAAEQQRIMGSMRDMQSIFDNIPFPMALRNVDSSLRIANRSLIDLVGDEENLRTQRFGGKAPEDEVARMDEALSRVMHTKASVTVPHSARHPDGSVHRYENTQIPLFNEFGDISDVVSISVDVTDSLRVQEHLTQEVQRLSELLDSSPVGVVIAVKGLVRFCNLRARQVVGVEVGSSVWDVPLLQGDPQGVLKQLESMPVVRDIPFALRDPQGRLRQLLFTVSRTMLEGERGTLIWAVDVTTLKDVEFQLIQARDAAEAATRAKSDFLATMSHEIRTPMNAVLGFTHLFERSNLNERQRGYLEKIALSASGLLRIINDILDFSKIEAGKLEMEHIPFRLSSCVDATHSIMGFSAREKGLELISHVAEDVPDSICGDRQRLNQVLINLLGNAVKFTEKGTVRLTVDLRKREDDGSVLLGFSVSDTGIGMSDEQISRIFQPFTQADASTSRKFGGTGLGLVISRRLVQLMGGDIEVNSGAQGTTFFFTIRVQPCMADAVPPSGIQTLEADTALTALRGQRVLVAEDNDINQEIAGAMLEEWGIVAEFANDGQQAVDMARRGDYALIFMDMQMPGMDGLEATRRIRALGAGQPGLAVLRTIPIVAMTANAMLDDRRRCLEAGMNDHLGKPIEPTQLRQKLVQWIVV